METETLSYCYLPDSLLEKVSHKLPMDSYMSLASYLGVTNSVLQYVPCECEPLAQAAEMLALWFKECNESADCETDAWGTLITALYNCGLKHAVTETRRFLASYIAVEGCYPSMTSLLKVHAYISSISDKIAEDWEAVGAYLGLSKHELTLIYHFQRVGADGRIKKPVYEVLNIWKLYQTSPPSKLMVVLADNMGRPDLALYVEGLTAGFSTNIKVPDTTPSLLTID